MNEKHLFAHGHLRDALEAHRQKMVAAIDGADVTQVTDGQPVEDIAHAFVQEFVVDAPVLTEGAVSVDVVETKVDVRYDHRRFIMDTSRPAYVPGIRATYFVPFTGDGGLFKLRPNTFTTVYPFASEVGKGELRFVSERADEDVAGTKADFDHNLKLIKEYLEWVTNDVNAFNASLPADARQRVQARQVRLQQLQQGVSGLGIPIRRPGASPSSGSIAIKPKAVKKPQPQETFDVALSFAGEQRDYVEQVATGLRDAGVSVFYDTFQRADLWGKNLVDHLAGVYQKGSRYVVMFISKEYVEKAWTTHERQHAQARALLAKEEYILPARFDDTDVPGMTNTVGHVDLRKTTPAELVTLIRAKVVKSS